MPSNSGAAQQEHSIKGTPAAAPESVDRSPGLANVDANQSCGMATRRYKDSEKQSRPNNPNVSRRPRPDHFRLGA